MDEQQQSRWRLTRKQLIWAGSIVALVFLSIVVCGYLFGWQWTGLPPSKTSPDKQSAKTLWDWMTLLIVPLVLAIGALLFTWSENKRARETAAQERDQDRMLANARQQDEILQAYLSEMSRMLTDKERPLTRVRVGDSPSTVARASTLAVLRRLDGGHKGSVVQFLTEAGLISKERTAISLERADLVWADLNRLDLRGTDLSTTILGGADLRGADLRGAALYRSVLSEAILTGADLTGANLLATYLRGADLRGADLRGVDLRGANLSETNMLGTNLSETHLRRADLREADLTRAFLVEADLSGASLIGANLSGAILINARAWTGEQLMEARTLEGAEMPDGTKLLGMTLEEWLEIQEREDAE